jgi:hypothetical protein
VPDFWTSSCYGLLERGAGGRLTVTDDYLRAYYQRPELAPLPESCAAELALHAMLMKEPRRAVGEAEIAAIADQDAQENYRIMLRFREKLLEAPTLEACYAGLFRNDVAVPPDFIHQAVEAMVRSMLDGTENGLEARAGELFFRRQRVTIERGAVMLADAVTVATHAATGGLGNLGRFLKEAQAPVKSVDLDVLDDKNHAQYWGRDERYDTVLDFNPGRPGSLAFARVLERWIAHFHGIEATVTPIREIPDEDWKWHVGLDAEATTLLNAIYNGGELDKDAMRRVVGLFRADFPAGALRAELQGVPVFMGLAMTPEGDVRMKPQNLLVNLPLAGRV